MQAPRVFDQERFFNGLMLILSGLFRKAVIADNCALIAERGVLRPAGPPNLADDVLGTYAFAWQIYGDFSGYSDIARGSAQLLGFHFMVNFRQPYLADEPAGFLAALAHQPEHVAARLPLHPARRQPARRGDDVSQPDADDAARRPVARRELDVRRLGRHSRRRPGGRAVLHASAGISEATGQQRSHTEVRSPTW